MFRRNAAPSLFAIASSRTTAIRILQTPEELQEAIERAEAFEHAHAYRGHSERYSAMSYGGQKAEELVSSESAKAS